MSRIEKTTAREGADGEPFDLADHEDFELQEIGAVILNDLAANDGLMDGLIELLDETTISALGAAAERVRADRAHERATRP